MDKSYTLEPCMVEALQRIEDYIDKLLGEPPTQKELANALTKFFVLKELGEFIEMERSNPNIS